MDILILIMLFAMNIIFGVHSIATDASPYIVAVNFFAAGFVAASIYCSYVYRRN